MVRMVNGVVCLLLLIVMLLGMLVNVVVVIIWVVLIWIVSALVLCSFCIRLRICVVCILFWGLLMNICIFVFFVVMVLVRMVSVLSCFWVVSIVVWELVDFELRLCCLVLRLDCFVVSWLWCLVMLLRICISLFCCRFDSFCLFCWVIWVISAKFSVVMSSVVRICVCVVCGCMVLCSSIYVCVCLRCELVLCCL